MRYDDDAMPMTDDAGLLRISGSIEHVIFSNEDSGFAICDLGTDTDELITITGTLPYVGEGDVVTVYGKWVHNPKYGRQFRVEQMEKQLPADRASILRYLSSKTIKGIGPKVAQRIVELFGEETFDVIENHPEMSFDGVDAVVEKLVPPKKEALKELNMKALSLGRDYKN